PHGQRPSVSRLLRRLQAGPMGYRPAHWFVGTAQSSPVPTRLRWSALAAPRPSAPFRYRSLPSHHTEKTVETAASRAEPRQHKAVDDAVRDHAGGGVRPRGLVSFEELALDHVNLLPLGHAAAITAASSPPGLCGLQVGSTVRGMHPCLGDKIIRHGLAVEI